ncbi:MAG: flagellar hook-associated protein FlgL [Candidatus Eisenbacteria bacterium]
MRISNRMLVQSTLRSIHRNLQSLSTAQEQANSGRRIRSISDGPIDAAQIMRLDAHIRSIAQYRRNTSSAETRLSTEEGVLGSVRELLTQAKEMAMSGASDDPDDPLRQAAAVSLRQLRVQLLSLGNTRIGDEYIFGGGETADAPFLPDGSYVGDGLIREIAIDDAVQIETNHTGDQIFSPAIDAIDALLQELESGTAESIQATIPVLDDAQQLALLAESEIGIRLGQVRDANDRLSSRSLNLEDRRDEARDVDPAEAILKVMSAQSALERAYEMVGQVLSIDILDYMD